MGKKELKNNKNGLIQSQKLLYTKLKRINQLFKVHISSLTLLFLFASGFIILWIYLLATGQVTTDIAQRYGLFGTIITVILTIGLSLLTIQMGGQGFFYSLFIIRGHRALKQAKVDDKARTTLYDGIVPYIVNFYGFFNRYSKEKTSLVMRVRSFLFINFFSGFYVIFFFTRLIDAEHVNELLKLVMVILFLSMLFFWIMNLITSNKIKNEIIKWESLFPKLDEWAQNIEQLSIENSKIYEMEPS